MMMKHLDIDLVEGNDISGHAKQASSVKPFTHGTFSSVGTPTLWNDDNEAFRHWSNRDCQKDDG